MIRKKHKKYLKTGLYIVVILFVLLNAGIIVQSYSLTHFDKEAKPIAPEYKPSVIETINIAIFGLKIPKPEVRHFPTQAFETVQIPIDNEKNLEAWILYTDSLKKGLVILFHGYIDEKSSMLDRAGAYLEMGYDAMLVDFMGSGGSYGNQTTMGFKEAENVKYAYDYALTILQEDKIILAGFSMGAAAIMRAQADYDLLTRALVLEAPYGTYKGTVIKRLDALGIPEWPVADLFTFWTGQINGFNAFEANPQDFAKKINAPTLLMCGGQDPNIPPQETELIFSMLASKDKKLKIFSESKHESYLNKYPNEWRNIVASFLSEVEQFDIYHKPK